MYKPNKISGFVALPIIIIGAVLAVGVLGGLAYEYKDKLSYSGVDKNKMLANVSSVAYNTYYGTGYQIQTLLGGSFIASGSGDLDIILRLTNTSATTKIFTWNNGCNNSYSIRNSNGVLIYDSVSGKPVCTEAIINISLQPNESKDWSFTVTNTGSLVAGTYKIIGSVMNYGDVSTEMTVVGNPSITVTSPNGGETFSAGTYMPIFWSSQNYPPYAGIDINLFKKKSSPVLSILTLGLYDEYDFNASIIRNAVNKYGQFGWTLPVDYSSGEYKIEISCSRNQGYGYGYGQNCISDVSDKPFTINKNTSPYASGMLIIGNQAVYLPGQTIKFSVKAVTYEGFAGGPDKGFNVQSWMQASSGETVSVNGVMQSVNATFNQGTGYWDVVMTAPSDTSKSYIVDSAFYCANSGFGCVSNQINKQFTFTIAASTQPDIQAQISALLVQIQALKNQLQTNEVQAQIATLMAQIQLLQSQLQVTSVCDPLSKSIVDAVGGCSGIDQVQYSNIYKACCTKVTKETLLSMLNNYLADGIINSTEKTNLLTALNSYLGQ